MLFTPHTLDYQCQLGHPDHHHDRSQLSTSIHVYLLRMYILALCLVEFKSWGGYNQGEGGNAGEKGIRCLKHEKDDVNIYT